MQKKTCQNEQPSVAACLSSINRYLIPQRPWSDPPFQITWSQKTAVIFLLIKRSLLFMATLFSPGQKMATKSETIDWFIIYCKAKGRSSLFVYNRKSFLAKKTEKQLSMTRPLFIYYLCRNIFFFYKKILDRPHYMWMYTHPEFNYS